MINIPRPPSIVKANPCKAIHVPWAIQVEKAFVICYDEIIYRYGSSLESGNTGYHVRYATGFKVREK
jgi:hypothetical protein